MPGHQGVERRGQGVGVDLAQDPTGGGDGVGRADPLRVPPVEQPEGTLPLRRRVHGQTTSTSGIAGDGAAQAWIRESTMSWARMGSRERTVSEMPWVASQ